MGEAAGRARVLIVDDERGPRESLRMILGGRLDVLQAEGGAEALEILGSREVDLVTLDLSMPGMRGEDLMREIRTRFPHVEVIVITGCGSVETAAEGIRLGVCDYITKPFDVVQVTASVLRALSRQRARTRLSLFLEALGAVVGRDREAQAILGDVERSQRLRGQLEGLFPDCDTDVSAKGGAEPPRTVAFLEVLAETMEAKDRFMRGHARRVAFYSSLIAERLSLPAQERELVRLAGFLHDLGKVAVPTDLLLRAGALEPAERSRVEEHPEIGARLLQPLELPSEVSAAIRHHHEWWDGTGYPDGIAGEEIPLAARIIGVADAFDAMSCDRPYRRALGRQTVVAELRRYAGTQFDPDLAKEFLAILETEACEVDAELLADVISDATAGTGLPVPVAG